ncbi:MarC family protein, partial [bacterium]|nr:MarC family protein [bacterium]
MDYQYLSLFLHAVPLVFAAIFPVLNPIGSAILLMPFTSGVDFPTRKLIARRVATNTFAVLTVVLFIGSHLLAFFGISIPVVQAAGGFVLASMGWKRLSAEDN